MKAEAAMWLGAAALVVLFWNGESGYDLHTALVTYLMR